MQLRYFNQTGWTAIFNGTKTEIGRMVRVEGWDPNRDSLGGRPATRGTAPGHGLRGLLPLGAGRSGGRRDTRWGMAGTLDG